MLHEAGYKKTTKKGMVVYIQMTDNHDEEEKKRPESGHGWHSISLPCIHTGCRMTIDTVSTTLLGRTWTLLHFLPPFVFVCSPSLLLKTEFFLSSLSLSLCPVLTNSRVANPFYPFLCPGGESTQHKHAPPTLPRCLYRCLQTDRTSMQADEQISFHWYASCHMR